MSVDLPQARAANTVICGGCNAANAPTRNFCGQCGQALWEVCATCKERTSAAEAFCGSCGANLIKALGGVVQGYEQTLVEAERLAMEFLFEDAFALLEPVLQLDHPRLQAIVERARKQRERLEEEQQERKVKAQASWAAAQAHWEKHDFRRASQAMKEIPEPLRNEGMLGLARELEIREAECGALLRQIRAKLAAKSSDRLLPLVEEYLQLDPHHGEVIRLAEKLRAKKQQYAIQQRDTLCEAARRSIEQHEYQAAVDQLQRIPQEARQGIYFKLLEYAEELCYLSHSLREAPHVDRVLISIAQRLLKHAPNDKFAADRLAEAQKRIDTTPRDPRAGAPEWAPAPKRTPLGMPVDWLGRFARLSPRDAKVREDVAAAPGRFCVAAGLALQGLQKGRVSINLLPPEKKGLLGRLGSVGRGRGASSAWGLDVGASALKVVKLSVGDEGKLIVDACELFEYEKELSRPDAKGQEGELIGDAIKTFIERHQPDQKNQPVAISVPGGRVLGRFLRVPRVKPGKVAELMQYEAAHQIPLPLESLCWGYQLLEGDRPEDKDSPMINCVLMGAQRSDMEQRVAWCQSAGLTVDIVQSECAALYNLAMVELFDAHSPAVENPDEDQVVLMDVGGDSAHVLIAGKRLLWFRTVGRGTNELTRRLIRAFNLTHERAEALKRNPAMAKQISKVYEALTPVMAELVNELQTTLTAYSTFQGSLEEENASPPLHFYGCGGGFLTHGFLRYFRYGN